MKLIITANELEKQFKRLTEQYDHFYWSTAWASSGSQPFNNLVINKGKIEKIVVGIHFYQTHPDFIEAFLNNKKVRFIQQPEGTFHPKLYLFIDKINNWELILGSANFTTAAFSKNTEASLLINHKDSDSVDIYNNAIKLVNQTFSEGKIFNKADLEKYRIAWNNQRQKIKSLSGQYGGRGRISKPIHEVPMMNRNWNEFINEVCQETSHGLERRLRVIEIAKSLFNRVDHFNELDIEERKFIAGIPNKLEIEGAEDWGYFGSMKGAGKFMMKINGNDIKISKALDQIPISGQITKKHYENFIKYFKQAFEVTL